MNNNLFKNLKYDFPSGIVVFLVAIPLCLGIALASGAPFMSGIIAGIIGGILVGLISNSALSVSGPAAGLAAIVLSTIQQLGAFETFLLAVVIAGAFQILLGILKAGVIAEYLPSNVIKGMLTAIGIIIILKQIPHAFGYDKDAEGDLTFLQKDGSNTFSALFEMIGKIDLGATIIAAVGLAILILWENKHVKKYVGLIPGGLVAVLSGIGLTYLFSILGNDWTIKSEHLVNVPVMKSFSDLTNELTFPDFSKITEMKVWVAGLTIMAVASVETLLCIEAVDKLDPEKRITNTNKELFAQGVGNMASGFIGGLPITSVIVRSSANVNANAKTKLSTIVHGFLILIFVLFLPFVLNAIPLASLAAILLVTGYKLAKPALFIDMFKKGVFQWIPFVVTVLAIVFTDLLTGVGIGLVISIAAILMGNFKNAYYLQEKNDSIDNTINITLAQEVSFLNKANIKQTLDHLPENSKVVIDATESFYIDFDVLEIIKEFKDIKAPLKNIELKTIGFRESYEVPNDNI